MSNRFFKAPTSCATVAHTSTSSCPSSSVASVLFIPPLITPHTVPGSQQNPSPNSHNVLQHRPSSPTMPRKPLRDAANPFSQPAHRLHRVLLFTVLSSFAKFTASDPRLGPTQAWSQAQSCLATGIGKHRVRIRYLSEATTKLSCHRDLGKSIQVSSLHSSYPRGPIL